MFLHKNIEVTVDGIKHRIEVEEHTRGGWKSDSLYIMRWAGRRITPFELKLFKPFKKTNIQYTVVGFMTLIYANMKGTIENIVYSGNPFLELVQSNDFR